MDGSAQADPFLAEAEYTRSQRRAAARVNRVIAFFGATTIASFMLADPFLIGAARASYYNLFAIPFVIILVVYALFTQTERYVAAPWADLILFVAVGALIFGIVDALARASEAIGWPRHTILFANFAIVLAYATVAFVARPAYFISWVTEVAQRLREGEAIADAYSDASVIFVDLVGSSRLARMLSPKHFVQTLNEIFSIADQAAAELDVEKVKTIGDAYLAISGARSGGGATAAVQFAKKVVSAVDNLAREKGLELSVRVGIHSGPVVGGVIGQTRATYDYWGDTMNVASRVQSAAAPGGISVTEPAYHASRAEVAYAPARAAVLKGIGETLVYDVAL